MLLAYDEVGTGPPMVLLHSGICDRRMWDPQLAALAPEFAVVRPDLRGFGESPLPAEPFSNHADVLELLDHLDIDRASVVGSSYGGRVALELATAAPQRVARLVLLCPAFGGLAPSEAATAFERAEEDLLERGDVAGAVELNVATWLAPEADEVTRARVAAMQRRAFDVQLAAEAGPEQPELTEVEVDPAAISAPTLVVSGGRDMDHFQAIAAHLAATIPNARHQPLDWAAHLPSLERPGPVTALLADFCR